MKIFLTGAGGQLGNELFPMLSALGETLAVDLNCAHSNAPGCRVLDMTDAGALETALNRFQPDLIINAAAYTAVDKAETDTRLAFAVNAEAPGRMARWAERNSAMLIHYSTDYVFDGSLNRAYREDDSPSPINAYGDSKLAGETAVQASGCQHLILRTSWVYSSHGSNFVLNMLKLAGQRLHLNVVNDQTGCPTWARNLAKVTVALLDTETFKPGGDSAVLHYCDNDARSWYEFALLVFSIAAEQGLIDKVPELTSVPSSGFPQTANRPKNSVLNTARIQEFGIIPAKLENSLRECLCEWRDHESRHA